MRLLWFGSSALISKEEKRGIGIIFQDKITLPSIKITCFKSSQGKSAVRFFDSKSFKQSHQKNHTI